MKLSIGSGQIRKPGWIHLDAVGGDINATIPPLPPQVTATRWEEVEMIHVLEHFYHWDAVQVLREIRDVLMPGGKLVIEVPNLRFACEVFTGQRTALPGTVEMQCDMWVLYGNPDLKTPYQVHRWGWTPDSLTKTLRDVGYATVAVLPAQHHVPERDFRIEAKC
jgi:SAM-dependent methyltransferase